MNDTCDQTKSTPDISADDIQPIAENKLTTNDNNPLSAITLDEMDIDDIPIQFRVCFISITINNKILFYLERFK
jgi:hypothetical protein